MKQIKAAQLNIGDKVRIISHKEPKITWSGTVIQTLWKSKGDVSYKISCIDWTMSTKYDSNPRGAWYEDENDFFLREATDV